MSFIIHADTRGETALTNVYDNQVAVNPAAGVGDSVGDGVRDVADVAAGKAVTEGKNKEDEQETQLLFSDVPDGMRYSQLQHSQGLHESLSSCLLQSKKDMGLFQGF